VKPAALGIDIGGTSARAAVVDENGVLLCSFRCATPGSLTELIEWVGRCIAGLDPASRVRGSIGLALPGVVDPTLGVCVRCVNLPWLEGQPVAEAIARKIGRTPLLLTDAQAATWGEFLAAGRPDDAFAHLRLGTGVACCVVRGRSIHPTDAGRRTHWPILVVDDSPDVPPCPCGLRGCLELFAGGKALTRLAVADGFESLGALGEAAESSPRASLLLDRTAGFVARGVINMEREFAVRTIVLGGGVVEVLPVLVHRIAAQATGVNVVPARLGDWAGVVGAAVAATAEDV
jgi:glucokinase